VCLRKIGDPVEHSSIEPSQLRPIGGFSTSAPAVGLTRRSRSSQSSESGDLAKKAHGGEVAWSQAARDLRIRPGD